MRVIDSTVDDFRRFINGKKVLCFGSGDYFKLFAFDFGDAADIIGVIDNDTGKHGTLAIAGKRQVMVFSIENAIRKFDLRGIILVFSASAYREMIADLQEMNEFNNVTCFVYAQIKYNSLKVADTLPEACDTPQIPPMIHYCWFGGKPLPENLKRCIESWSKLCPNYEIIEWNESNYHYQKCAWTEMAYAKKQWAYLADYARIDMIATQGGIYLDTDVELLQSLDGLRCYRGFVATEAHGGINLGSGFGAIAGLGIFQELLESFNCEFEDEVKFCRNVGRETEVFWKYGYRLSGESQVIKEVLVLPFHIMTPIVNDTGKDFTTDATVSVHHFNRGWKVG